MKHDSHRTPFRTAAALLAALLLTGPLAAGCSLGRISEMAKELAQKVKESVPMNLNGR